MHVRYLQHSSHGTVQLLMMPLSAAVVGDSFRETKGGNEEDGGESEPIPLPIQSFLWRQTHPFLGARVSKLQEASCVSFERVIVQNILHGISPSLSDAIGSISRWNFVRAAFPHINQCCAALLTERAGEEEGLAMSSSLVKTLYILHWLLIDAAVECNENSLTTDNATSAGGVLSVRQLTYSVASIQLFVYLLAPLFNVVREEEIEGHIRLESGLRLWQNLWQQRLPELLCFSAPVKQRRNQLPQLNTTPWAKRVQSTAAEQGIYVGEKVAALAAVGQPAMPPSKERRSSHFPPSSSSPPPPPSIQSPPTTAPQEGGAIPPPKPPRTDLNVLRELEEKKNKVGEKMHGQELAASGGIVRSVSDYKSAAIAEKSRDKLGALRKSRTTTTAFQSTSLEEYSPDSPADDFSCSGIKCMDEMFREEADGFSAFDPSLKSLNGKQTGEAPLVQLKDICSTTSMDTASTISTAEEENRGKTTTAKTMTEEQGTPLASVPRAIPKTLVCSPSGEDTASVCSQQTVINVRSATTPMPFPVHPAAQQPIRPPQISFTRRSDSELSGGDREKLDTPPASTDPHEANYLDVAVIRCLLIRNWAEEGVFWAIRYLLNRLLAMRQYRHSHEGAFRSRCNSDSAAIPARKTSKNEAANLDSQGYLTWADLQDRTDAISKRLAERQQQMEQQQELDERRGVAFEKMEGDGRGDKRDAGLNVPVGGGEKAERRRRISVNTLPSKPTKKASRTDTAIFRGIRRCRTEPALLPRLNELLLSFSSEPSSAPTATQQEQQKQVGGRKASSQFFPEAIGSSPFIDQKGHLNVPIVLNVLGILMERCSIVRVSEVALNICDTLLNMPGTDQAIFFPGLLHIVHRICLQLGCPNGCNEGIRTPQAEFLRVKLRNLIAQMHRINAKLLNELLCEQVGRIHIGQMVDALHALTVFCQISPAFNRHQQRSSRLASQKPVNNHRQSGTSASIRRQSPSLRNPSYKNHFNESKSGIEGVLISALLGPLLTKLAASGAELGQPENMSLAQDVRLLVCYVYEKHGNPLRRCALSAMAAKTLSRASIVVESPWTVPPANVKNVPSNPTLAPPQREGAASLRRGLFRKKEWMQTTLTNEGAGDSSDGGADNKGGGGGSSQSTPPPQLIPSASVDDSIGSPQQHLPVKKGKSSAAGKSTGGGGGGRLQFALSLLKGTRPGGSGSEQAVNSEEDEGSSNPADDQQQLEDDGSLGGSSIDASSGRGGRIGGGLRTASSRLATPRGHFGGADAEERAETTTPNLPQFLPPLKLVQIKEIRDGAARFAFLLESSKPGNFPDAPLVAAIAELKSPVLARCVLLLECVNFVHRCNRGDWPDWIRSGMSFPGRTFGNIPPQTPIHPQSSMRMGGGGVTGGGGGGGASRRTALLQRALGRAFYSWAYQLGIRLQRQLDIEEKGTDRRQLKLMDELEDFLDDGTVNDPAKGEAMPVALELMVCALLQQITAFLRETFQSLPRTRQLSQKTTSAISTGWERLQSHRRWSILSNTFNPQVQQMVQQQQQPLGSGSIHSINELHPERRISYSTADEENSPRGSHDLNSEEQPLGGGQAAKVRRLAQGRQRLLKRNSPSAGAGAGIVQTPPPSATDSIGGVHNRSFRESFRVRKISKASGQPPASTAIPIEPEGAEQQPFPSESMPLMRRATTDSPAEPHHPQRVVSFVQRRRRTTSFKSRVSRSLIPRHSMRVGRMSVDQQDLEAGGLLADEEEAAILSASHPITPTPTLASHGSPRSPIFMLSIAKQANPGSRLKPNFEQPPSMPSPERLSSSTGGASVQQFQQEQAEEEDEEEMLKNMPWLNTLLAFSQKYDFACPHEHFCSKWCFERVYRQSHRLLEALLVVYGKISPEKRVDRRQQFIERWQNSQQDAKKRHSSNPPRRESANVRQSGVDRMPLALRGLIIEKLNEIEENRAKKIDEVDVAVEPKELRAPRPPPIVGVLRVQLLDLVHCPLSALLKGVVVLKGESLVPVVPIAWALLNRIDDTNLSATAAALFICCAVKCPQECTNLMAADLYSPDPTIRTSAVRRFYILWRQRFHVWLKMEDGAQLIFKVPPPSIDFTLPSPSIGQSQVPIVDPPWMPPVKTKVEELSLKEEEQSTSQTIMTMTRTRRKQKQEMVRKAVRKAEERQRELREQFPLRATAFVQQAAYEPALFQHQLMADGGQAGEDAATEPVSRQMIIPVAQPLFPSSILSVVPTIVELLDDPQMDQNGVTVSETCRSMIFNCLVEDTALFLRHFFEKFTNRAKQEQMMALLRRLVLTFRPIPSQTAHTLLNALLGLVMFYVRTPGEGTDRSLALSLSLCWLVIPYVQGLYFKDLKQTLKKEQCDQAIMITANVPSAKKVIVHGPDSHQGGIPTQFPLLEETLFQHLLADSIEYYNIEPAEADNYFLYDPKTFVLHNPGAYVRDFYFFHRSFYPQLQLVRLDPQLAHRRIREHAFQQKVIEIGKVLLTHNALRHSPEAVLPQRIFFLHDEFTHLPSFPRRAVESCFGMYQGRGGDELQTMDALHKFVWAKLMTNMFEKMENVFMFGDLHLFINVINGVMIIHCEDVLILRRCMAAYLAMSIHFQSLFASQGFFLVMPTILRCYSQRQPNRLFTQVVEFVCKQFYILHRKPFLLQMFGSIADILDQNESDLEASPMRVKAKYLFSLLLAMERMMEPLDQLDILSLLPYPKPLQALDLCYKDEPNMFTILTDAMASCVTICAFAPESRRSHQMLLCMQSMLPHLLQHIEEETQNQASSPAVLKHELAAFSTLGVEMRALVNSCDVLARGPTRSFDFLPAGSSGAAHDYPRGRSFLGADRADSPQFFDPPTIVDDDPSRQQQPAGGGQSHSSGGGGGGGARAEKKITSAGWADGTAAADIEIQKEQFRGPRDAMLTLCAMFIRRGSARLKELGKLTAGLEHTRMPDMLDHKCHVKLLEFAVSLLKLAPYDANTLACLGLRQYFVHVLPIVDWSVETNRSAINIILRRLDKTIAKIAKRPSTRRRANWNAISCWLGGLHQTLLHSPYIAHLHSLKTITLLCLRLTLGDTLGPSEEQTGPQQPNISTPAIAHTVLSAHIPPASFCSIVLKLASFLMTTLGQLVFSLDLICTSDCLGPLADRPEALLCQFLIPMFLRAAISGKESPQFQPKDLSFCLGLLQNAICPPLAAKQSVVPAISGSSLATSLIRDTAGRQGSVSVTDKGGYSATVSTTRIVRDSVVLAVMLAIKTIIISFQKQLNVVHWLRIARIVREMVAKKCGGAALSPFLKFMMGSSLPIAEMLQPIVQSKLNQRPANEQDSAWQAELREKLAKVKSQPQIEPFRKGLFAQLRALHRELQLLKEDFINRNLEIPRSHTPTIGGELHSDSGSSQGTGMRESRRLSSSTALGKLRWIQSRGGGGAEDRGAKCSLPNQQTLQDNTIPEDVAAEEENATTTNGGPSPAGRPGSRGVNKSPSLPFAHHSRGSMRHQQQGSMGMFRSMRKKQAAVVRSAEGGGGMRQQGGETEEGGGGAREQGGGSGVEMKEVGPELGKRSMRRPIPRPSQEESVPGTSQEPTEPSTPSQSSLAFGERPRVVSFSTPRHSSVSQTISEADSEGEFAITSTKHLI